MKVIYVETIDGKIFEVVERHPYFPAITVKSDDEDRMLTFYTDEIRQQWEEEQE